MLSRAIPRRRASPPTRPQTQWSRGPSQRPRRSPRPRPFTRSLPSTKPAAEQEPAPEYEPSQRIRAGHGIRVASSTDTGAVSAHFAAPPTQPVIRPRLTDHELPEQLSLAEKLGLRAPGGNDGDPDEQNVGPTK